MSLERRTEKEKIDEEKIRGNNALKHFNSRYCVFLIKSVSSAYDFFLITYVYAAFHKKLYYCRTVGKKTLYKGL